MPVLTIEYRDEAERLGLEQAIAFFTPDASGRPDRPRRHGPGRLRGSRPARRARLLRTSLAAAVAEPRRGGRAKRGAARAGPARAPRRPLQGAARTPALTAVGPMDVGRRYFTCPACGQGDFGADRVLGLDGYLTDAARRMACLAGRARSRSPEAEQLLAELAGWDLDDETIRRLCHAEAARATATRDGTGDGRGVRGRPRRLGVADRRGQGQHPRGLARRQGGGVRPPGAGGTGRRRGLGPTGSAASVGAFGGGGGRGGVGVRRACAAEARRLLGLEPRALERVGGRGGVDLEAVGASLPGGVGEPGHLPRGRARGGGGRRVFGEGTAGGAGGGGAGTDAALGGRLLGGGGVGRGRWAAGCRRAGTGRRWGRR